MIRLCSMLTVALGLTFLAGGCIVQQSQDTPVDYTKVVEPKTDEPYYLYVPSYYTSSRDWPLVITLQGTVPWDTYSRQIREWRKLAEDKGFIVAAPKLRSSQGILPLIDSLWFKDLAHDEEVILGVLDHVAQKYAIDRQAVLLTGFSSGGLPMYYTGLRNPGRFDMLIARACNANLKLFERVELTDETRKLPVAIFWGKDDFKSIRDQSWLAYRWLYQRGVKPTRQEFGGGHIRRPDVAWEMWKNHLPRKYRR